MRGALAYAVLFGAALASGAPAPEVICPKTAIPPKVDGVLSANEWDRAAQIERFFVLGSDERPPAATRILLLHDADRLYLCAECDFRPGHVVSSSVDADDGDDIWRDDGIELFVDAHVTQPGFVQIILNSKGRVYDGRTGSGVPGVDWDMEPRPTVAASVTEGRLLLEAAIPFAALGARPKTGDLWGLKVCRTHWDRSPTNRPNRPGDLFTATVPGVGSYAARPFGRLIFGQRNSRTARLLRGMAAASASKAHPYHGLEEVKRTHVWAKPCRKLTRKGVGRGERLIFRDTATGAEIWRVTFNAGMDAVPYANTFPWSADGSLFLFSSRKRINGNWYMLMSADGTRIWRPEGYSAMAQARWSRDDPHGVMCSRGRALHRVNVLTGRKTAIASLPPSVPGRVTFGARGRWAAACKQGFGEGGILTLIDLKTGATRMISLRTASKDFGGDWLYSGGIGYVKDKPYVGYSLNHLPHLSREHKYQQWSMDIETGEFRLIRYLSHGGTSPRGDRKVGYGSGGVYTTDMYGDDKRFVTRIDTGGHIAWMSSPEWCLAGNGGAPGTSAFASQLVQVFVNTGNWCRIAHGQTANSTYSSYLFTNTSPDGTKGEYTSTMLGPKDVYWVVVHRPQPPDAVAAERTDRGVRLTWVAPEVSREIAGYRVWRADRSGGPYALVSGRKPVVATEWIDGDAPTDRALYYAATSIEHSTLESRRFSTEVAVPPAGGKGWPGVVRCYLEAEQGDTERPVAVDFSGSASCDRFVAHRHGAGEGTLSLSVNMARPGRFGLWARVRGKGAWRVGPQARIRVNTQTWQWQKLPVAVSLAAGPGKVRLVTADKGLAVDQVLLTDDEACTPLGLRERITPAPAVPAGLRVTNAGRFDVGLAWEPSPLPHHHHYQVYRGRKPGFPPAQASLVGSPADTEFLDWGLDPGETYHYGVTAVDTFGNESAPVRVTAHTLPVAGRVRVTVQAESGTAHNGRHETVSDAKADGGRYIVTPKEVVTGTPCRLSLPFEVARADEYVVWLSLCPVVDSHVYLNVAIDAKQTAHMYVNNTRRGKPSSQFMWRPVGAVGGVTPVVWQLSAGKHVLTLSLVGKPGYAGRATAIDAAIVTNDLSYVPEGRVWDWN